MKKFSRKITVLVCMTTFESSGSSSDDHSDSALEASYFIDSL